MLRVSVTIRPSSISTWRGKPRGEVAVVGDHGDRRPAACSSWSSARIAAPVVLSRLPVGSSASTIACRPTSARAIATRWRSPPESCVGRASAGRRARPPRARPLPARAARRRERRRRAARRRRSRARSRARRGRTAGRRSRSGSRAAPPARGPTSSATSRPVTRTVPELGPVERAHQVQQRRLAGAGRADDREQLAAMDAEADAVERDHRRLGAVGLAHVVELEHRLAVRVGAGRGRQGRGGDATALIRSAPPRACRRPARCR